MNPELASTAPGFRNAADIAAGTAVRFEPGEEREVDLVASGGDREVFGLNRLTEGKATPDRLEEALARALRAATREPDRSGTEDQPPRLRRALRPPSATACASATRPWAEVERDYTVYGDECVFRGGKTLRDGLGTHEVDGAEGALDFVITNALAVDAAQGIVKADIGIKEGRIAGIGKAGGRSRWTASRLQPGRRRQHRRAP